jgi:hypothetical protein
MVLLGSGCNGENCQNCSSLLDARVEMKIKINNLNGITREMEKSCHLVGRRTVSLF